MTDQDLEEIPTIRNLVAAIPLPTLLIGAAAQIVLQNDAAESLLGKDITGRHFTTILRHPRLVEAVERSLKDRGARDISYQVVEGGNDLSYDAHLREVAGTSLLLLSFHDKTDITKAEQMRRDYIANISHELRTPLTALTGFIETLRGPARNDAEAREHFLGIMADEAERMNRLVKGLLLLGRVEADERVRPAAQVDLRDVVQTTLRNLEPLAQESNVTWQFDAGAAPLPVSGDSDQLLQVFTNLVENAIKYGGADQRIAITIRRGPHDPVLRGPAIEIEVADQGPGIDPIHLPRLTERFYRADDHRSRDQGGIGLGLAIVKHILNRHRGRLKITSQPGQGSQFTVILPPTGKAPAPAGQP